jgi:membrane protein DedA with SNARE-associated domain
VNARGPGWPESAASWQPAAPGRFIVGLRELNGINAGVKGMHWLRFLSRYSAYLLIALVMLLAAYL